MGNHFISTKTISNQDLELLKASKNKMEQLSLAIRAVNKIGNATESTIKMIPEKALETLQKSTKSILLGIIKSNLISIKKNKTFKKPSNHTYKIIVTGSGALSGFLGSSTGIGTAIFISELALTTKFIMRTIMDIARSEGEDIYTLEGQLACLQVFALGGSSNEDDGMETSYYTTRTALATSLKKVTASGLKMTLDGLVKGSTTLGSKTLTNFISKIASRLTVLISEKFLVQIIPVISAVSGGALNYIFIDHFQNMATAHFTIKRLERKYGIEKVKASYDSF